MLQVNLKTKNQSGQGPDDNEIRTYEDYRLAIKNIETLYALTADQRALGNWTEQQLIEKCRNESRILVEAFSRISISKENECLDFPLGERWLNGEEYAFILRHYRAYQLMNPNQITISQCGHPEQIYELPRNGQVYFIKGWHLREFGFPRENDLRKIFKWKKMNFTTDLPKQDPICSYLVATGKIESQCYRMHVVVNSKEYSKEYRKSEVLKELKSGQLQFEYNNPGFQPKDKEKQKLLPGDRISTSERIILCHVIRINCDGQQGNVPTKVQNKRIRSMRRSNRKKNKNKGCRGRYKYSSEEEESEDDGLSVEEDFIVGSDNEFDKENMEPDPVIQQMEGAQENLQVFNELEWNETGGRRITRCQVKKQQKLSLGVAGLQQQPKSQARRRARQNDGPKRGRGRPSKKAKMSEEARNEVTVVQPLPFPGPGDWPTWDQLGMRKPEAPNHVDDDMIYQAINKSKNPERTVEFSKMKSLNPEIEYEDFEEMQNIQHEKQIETQYQGENRHLDHDCTLQAELEQPPARSPVVEDGDTVSENLTSEIKVEEVPIENDQQMDESQKGENERIDLDQTMNELMQCEEELEIPIIDRKSNQAQRSSPRHQEDAFTDFRAKFLQNDLNMEYPRVSESPVKEQVSAASICLESVVAKPKEMGATETQEPKKSNFQDIQLKDYYPGALTTPSLDFPFCQDPHCFSHFTSFVQQQKLCDLNGYPTQFMMSLPPASQDFSSDCDSQEFNKFNRCSPTAILNCDSIMPTASDFLLEQTAAQYHRATTHCPQTPAPQMHHGSRRFRAGHHKWTENGHSGDQSSSGKSKRWRRLSGQKHVLKCTPRMDQQHFFIKPKKLQFDDQFDKFFH